MLDVAILAANTGQLKVTLQVAISNFYVKFASKNIWQNCTTPPDHWDVGI